MTDQVIVIVGPTAVGKTKLSVELALKLNGEIISGDSMQIYREMDIGTAKVTKEEMQGVPHHLIDIKNFDEDYSVKEFQQNVRDCIQAIQKRQRVPIIVGGTGLYIKAALYDYTFQEETESFGDPYPDMTNEELHLRLNQVDPLSAQKIHPNNRRRVLRALQIFEQSGKSKSEHLSSQQHVCLYNVRFIGLTLPRPLLYERINQRVDAMMKLGLIEEVERLIQLGALSSHQSMKAIGYKEWFDYFNQSTSLEETLEKIKQNSRRYAKRQYTWFRNQMDIHWLNVNIDDFDQTVQAALKYVANGEHYHYIAFNYAFQDLDYFKHSGILDYWFGYTQGEKENPTMYELRTQRFHHQVLIVIYFDETLISAKALKSLYQQGLSEKVCSYVKPEWADDGIQIDKLVRIKELV